MNWTSLAFSRLCIIFPIIVIKILLQFNYILEEWEFCNHIIQIANNTIYGLTGALVSNNRKNIERARAEMHCGNLYFNRKCTGALVDVQPFGGFNMSGTDSKAGGRDYLLLFCQAKSVTEKFF